MGKLRPKVDKTKEQIGKEIQDRTMGVYSVLIVIVVIIVARILFLQYSHTGVELRTKGDGSISFRKRVVTATRGDILSFDNNYLATTMPEYEIFLDFQSTGIDKSRNSSYPSELDSLSIKLANYFNDKRANEYKNNFLDGLAAKSRYTRATPYKINYNQLQDILKFPLLRLGRFKGGYNIVKYDTREKPYGKLADKVIGRMPYKIAIKRSNNRIDTVIKYEGLDGGQDSILRGVDGITRIQKVSGSFWEPKPSDINREPVDGIDIISTINIEVQDVADQFLRKQLEECKAEWGCAILMEVESGEIRVMANLGKKANGEYSEIYNYAIGENMEPGSTFKLVSLMALLEDRGMTINDIVDCGTGKEWVGPSYVRDTKIGGHGRITLGRAFEVSSNIGFSSSIYNSYKDNPQQYCDFIYNRSFHKPFGLEVQGEAAPLIRNPKDKLWRGTTLPMMAWGYEMMMTPIHTIAIYNSIANNGTYIKPRLIRGYKRKGGNAVMVPVDTICPSVCSPSTLRQIKYTMEQVTNDGTANMLHNPHYRVAGKTGTAQVAKGGRYTYDGGRYYLASIVGYFPAENPKYTCLVAAKVFHKDGTTDPYYGGVVAGPVLRAIADKVYSQAIDWGHKAQRPIIENKQKDKKSSTPPTPPTRKAIIKGGSVADIKKAAELVKIPLSTPPKGNIVIDSNLKVMPSNQNRGQVPSLHGMGLKDALYIANQHGLVVRFKGQGAVNAQKPDPKTAYNLGDTLYLELN